MQKFIFLLICIFFLPVISCTTVKEQEPAEQAGTQEVAIFVEQEKQTGEADLSLSLPEVAAPEITDPALRSLFALLMDMPALPVKTNMQQAEPALPSAPQAAPAPEEPVLILVPEEKTQVETTINSQEQDAINNQEAENTKTGIRVTNKKPFLPVLTAKPTTARTTLPKKMPTPLHTKNSTPVPAPIPIASTAVTVKDEKNTRNALYAKPGTEIDITLKNKDWIFPGFTQVTDSEGLTFISREVTGNQTRFLFKTKKLGDYLLDFMLQDNYAGKEEKAEYLVKVVPESQFYAILNGNLNESKAEEENSLEKADQFYDQKKYAQALSEYLKHYDEASDYLNARVAAIYELLGDYETAGKYWERNMTALPPYNEQALTGILRTALKLDDINTVLKYWDAFKDIVNPQAGNDLVALAGYLEKKGKPAFAIELLDTYRQNIARGGTLDRIYFALAALYEKDTDYRDLKKAKKYYQLVYKDYPEGELAGAAEERVKYLDRHFFYFW